MINKARKTLEKTNEKIDAVLEYRNKQLKKTLMLWVMASGCYIMHYNDIFVGLAYILQIIFIVYSLFTLATALFITYAEFLTVSKIDNINAGGKVSRFIIEQLKSVVIDKIRNVKKKEKIETAEFTNVDSENIDNTKFVRKKEQKIEDAIIIEKN